MPSENTQIEALEKPLVFHIKAAVEGEEVSPEKFWDQLRNYYRTAELPKGYKHPKLVSVFSHQLAGEIKDSHTEAKESTSGAPLLFKTLNDGVAIYQQVISARFRQKSADLMNALKVLLKVPENQKTIGEIYDFAEEVIAFEKLSGLIPETEGKQLTKSRSQRLVRVLDMLQHGLKYLEGKLATVMIAEGMAMEHETLSHCEIITEKDDVFSKADETIREQMDHFLAIIKAFRIAELEVDGAYKEDIHNEYFDHFSWYQLTAEERRLFHPFIIVVDHAYLMANLDIYSQLLASNWPFKFIVLNNQGVSQTAEHVSWEDAAHRYRQELSMLTIAHRNVFTFQSTLQSKSTLMQGINGCLHSSGPSQAHILLPENGDKIITDRAAALSRYFPNIKYNPEADPKAGPRLSLEGNEQPMKDWPVFELTIDEGVGDGTMELPFIYADYKAFFPSKVKELMIIPSAFYGDKHLIPLSEYLTLKPDQLIGKVPYILLADGESGLYKAAVPNVWVVSCQERLDFWQFLQEMGRVEAQDVQEKPQNITTDQTNLITALKHKHEQEIRQIRESAVKQAAEQLLGTLLRDK